MIADLYDFDKTLYPKDSASAYWMFCLKKQPKIAKHIPHQISSAVKFAFKKITLTQFKEEFFCFVKSIDAEKMAEEFWNKNGDKIYSWFKSKEKDAVAVVCSASPEFEIAPILKKLDIDIIIGTKMDSKTGKILGENCKGSKKVDCILKEAKDLKFRNAYTDNPKSDAPMLNLAENKFIIKNGIVEEYNI